MARGRAVVYDCMFCDNNPCTCITTRRQYKFDIMAITGEEAKKPPPRKRALNAVPDIPVEVVEPTDPPPVVETVLVEAPQQRAKLALAAPPIEERSARGIAAIQQEEAVEDHRWAVALTVLFESGMVDYRDMIEHKDYILLPPLERDALIWRCMRGQFGRAHEENKRRPPAGNADTSGTDHNDAVDASVSGGFNTRSNAGTLRASYGA